MLRSGRARAGAHAARTLWIPVGSLGCSPQRRCRVLDDLRSSPTAIKASRGRQGCRGRRGRRLAPARRVSGQHRRAAPATGKCPTDSCCLVYLKALFLRENPATKIHPGNKKKGTNSHLRRLGETEADAPGSPCGSVRFCLQRFACSAPAADRRGPRGRPEP